MSNAHDRYIAAMVSLTPDQLDAFIELLAPDARFKDPFHDVGGRTQIRAVFAHMYKVLSEVRFEPNSRAANGNKLFLSWTFKAKQRWSGDVSFPGASEITFGPDGFVAEHIDYWDKADLYKNLNVVGRLLSAIASVLRR